MALTRTQFGAGLVGLAMLGVTLVGWLGAASAPDQPAQVSTWGGHDAPFAPSMRGTVPDGDLRAASANLAQAPGGKALAYAELRRLFDYYLSAVGEQSLGAITIEIQRAIAQNLPQQQVSDAMRLLDKYLQFKRALVDLEKSPQLAGDSVQVIRRRFHALQDLRSRIFTAEEDQGLFGFDDMYDRDTLARLEIDRDATLSAGQKREKLAALDASMPPALRADRDAPRMVLQLEQTAQDMRAKGASEDEIYRMRALALNPQAAERLAEVDREEKAWKDRIATYQADRARILKAQADAPESERQAALLQLQQAQFSEQERRRLAAYEQ